MIHIRNAEFVVLVVVVHCSQSHTLTQRVANNKFSVGLVVCAMRIAITNLVCAIVNDQNVNRMSNWNWMRPTKYRGRNSMLIAKQNYKIWFIGHGTKFAVVDSIRLAIDDRVSRVSNTQATGVRVGGVKLQFIRRWSCCRLRMVNDFTFGHSTLEVASEIDFCMASSLSVSCCELS